MSEVVQEAVVAESFVPDPPPERIVGTPAELADAREQAGFTQQAVADILRLDVRQIAMLETGNFQRLPGPAFAQGAIRAIGRLIEVDPSALVASVGLTPGSDSTLDRVAPMAARPVAAAGAMATAGDQVRKWRALGLPLAALGVVGALIFAGVSEPLSDRQDTQSTIVQVPLPNMAGVRTNTTPVTTEKSVIVPAGVRPAIRTLPTLQTVAARPAVPAFEPGFTEKADAAVLPMPAKALSAEPVQLSFSKPTWVDIRHKNGEKLLFGTQKAAKSLTIRGIPPMQVVIGNPDGVKMRFRGESVDIHAKARKGVSRFILN